MITDGKEAMQYRIDQLETKEGNYDKLDISIGHVDAEDWDDMVNAGSYAFVAALEKITGGAITGTVFPNGQLGDERSMAEAVQNGSLDACFIADSVATNFSATAALNNLPFIYPDASAARAVTSGDIGQRILDTFSDVGIKALTYGENGFRWLLNNRNEVKTAADVKGLKLRVIQSPVYVSTYEALSASPVPMAYGEVYAALSQGVVDGFDLMSPLVVSSKFYVC